MQITVKGQVTIPKRIRVRFGYLPHTEVEFVVKNGLVVLQKAKTKTINKSPLLKMVGGAKTSLTTNEIMKLTRK